MAWVVLGTGLICDDCASERGIEQDKAPPAGTERVDPRQVLTAGGPCTCDACQGELK